VKYIAATVDYVVETEQVVDSLKQRNLPVKYVLFPDEGHPYIRFGNGVS